MQTNRRVALITGSAQRIGKSIAQHLHQRGIDIALHCFSSDTAANQLKHQLNKMRPNSCFVFSFDLSAKDQPALLIAGVLKHFSRLDFLVNNASIFYPTPFTNFLDTDLESNDAKFSSESLNRFIQVNFLTPLKLSQTAFPYLKANHGAIVNLIDIYAKAGLANHTEYVASKEALLLATRRMAQEFAPDVRVNGISPGAILWPDSADQLAAQQAEIVANTALQRTGLADDIAKTAGFLLLDASYSTGSTIAVDGGRQLYI